MRGLVANYRGMVARIEIDNHKHIPSTEWREHQNDLIRAMSVGYRPLIEHYGKIPMLMASPDDDYYGLEYVGVDGNPEFYIYLLDKPLTSNMVERIFVGLGMMGNPEYIELAMRKASYQHNHQRSWLNRDGLKVYLFFGAMMGSHIELMNSLSYELGTCPVGDACRNLRETKLTTFLSYDGLRHFLNDDRFSILRTTGGMGPNILTVVYITTLSTAPLYVLKWFIQRMLHVSLSRVSPIAVEYLIARYEGTRGHMATRIAMAEVLYMRALKWDADPAIIRQIERLGLIDVIPTVIEKKKQVPNQNKLIREIMRLCPNIDLDRYLDGHTS